MRSAFVLLLILPLVPAASSNAQPAAPNTYTLVMDAHMPGSGQIISLTIYRDGSRERIEVGEEVQLFDFDAHKVFWFTAGSRQKCSAGRYLSARAPIEQDLITGSADSLAQMASGARRKFIRREVVNGIPARLEELTGAPKPSSPSAVNVTRVWLAEQGDFIVKLEGTDKAGQSGTVAEVKHFSTQKPSQALLLPPINCTVGNSEMDDSGTIRAHAEAAISATGSGSVNLGDGTTSGSGAVSMQTGKTTPTSAGKLTEVILKAVERDYPGPCGRKLEVTGELKADGPATIWYRFYANVGGVEFSGGQDGTINIDSSGSAFMVKDATFLANKQGELRLQAAVQGSSGRHGAVTISNVVPFHVICSNPPQGK